MPRRKVPQTAQEVKKAKKEAAQRNQAQIINGEIELKPSVSRDINEKVKRTLNGKCTDIPAPTKARKIVIAVTHLHSAKSSTFTEALRDLTIARHITGHNVTHGDVVWLKGFWKNLAEEEEGEDGTPAQAGVASSSTDIVAPAAQTHVENIGGEMQRLLGLSLMTNNATKNRQGLYGYISLAPPLDADHTEACLLSLEQLNLSKADDAKHGLELLKTLYQKGLVTTHEGLIKEYASIIDAVLIAACEFSLRKKSKAHDWWVDNRYLFSNDPGASNIDTLFANEKNLVAYHELLATMVRTSQIAKLFFQKHIYDVDCKLLDTVVMDLGSKLLVAARASKREEFMAAKASLFEKSKEYAMKYVGESHADREANYTYHGAQIKKVKVKDFYDQSMHQVASVRKACSLGKKDGLLYMNPVEKQYFKVSDSPTEDCFFSKQDLSEDIAARKWIAARCATSPKPDYHTMLAHLDAQLGQWQEKDPYWALDYNWFKTLGEGGYALKTVHEDFQAMLPKEGVVLSFDVVIGKFEQYQSKEIFKFLTPDQVETVNAGKQLLEKAENSTLKKTEYNQATGWALQVKNSLKWFLSYAPIAVGEVAGVKKFGDQAIEAIKAELAKPDDAIQLKALSLATQFSYLFTACEVKKVAKVSEKRVVITSGTAKAAKKKAASQEVETQAQTTDQVAMMMGASLFKKKRGQQQAPGTVSATAVAS